MWRGSVFGIVTAISLTIAVPAFAQSDRVSHIAIGAFMVGQFSDAMTTEYCIGAGLCREANPLMRWANHQPVAMAMVKGGVATVASVALIKAHRIHAKATFLVTIGLTVGQAWLTVHNWHVYTQEAARRQAR